MIPAVLFSIYFSLLFLRHEVSIWWILFVAFYSPCNSVGKLCWEHWSDSSVRHSGVLAVLVAVGSLCRCWHSSLGLILSHRLRYQSVRIYLLPPDASSSVHTLKATACYPQLIYQAYLVFCTCFCEWSCVRGMHLHLVSFLSGCCCSTSGKQAFG